MGQHTTRDTAGGPDDPRRAQPIRRVGPERNAPTHMLRDAFAGGGQMKLYLDMDGVLMDFDHALVDNGLFVWNQRPGNRTYHHLPRGEWTMDEKEHDEDISKLMDRTEFWAGIKPMGDAYALWDYCRGYSDVEILTARPHNEAAADRVSSAKIKSIHQHFDPTFPVEHINICLRSQKKDFAAGNILVDDLPGNCKDWCEAGGHAILHKDAATTIMLLRELIHV